jgi:hypothetical protein
MEKDHWKLSKEEYDKLLAFLGYGNFSEADIIVFGNEEGTGGYSIEANVKARCNSYGKDRDGNYIHSLSPNDWKDGYWDLQENEERPKIEKHLLPEEKIQEQGFVKGAFLPAISRMCLGLEAVSDEVDRWFQSYGANPTAGNQIKEHIRQKLFKKHEGIQTALVDWRPLPRNNEKTWYPIEYKHISHTSTKNPYLRAFNNPKKIKNNITSFSDFNKDVEQRAVTIKSLLEATPAKVIIGLGGADGIKKGALEKMFGDIFEQLVIESVDVSYLKMYKARISLKKKDLYIFLLPFPVAGNVFKSQDDVLGVLKEITVKHLAPIIGRKKVLFQ